MRAQKTLSKISPILNKLTLIVILVSLFVGFFAGLNYQHDFSAKKGKLTPQSPTASSESAWLRYQNTEYAFEIRYPKMWESLGTCNYQAFCISVINFADYPTEKRGDAMTRAEYRNIQNKIETDQPLEGFYKNWNIVTVDNVKGIQFVGYDNPSGRYLLSTKFYTDDYYLSIEYKLPEHNPVDSKDIQYIMKRNRQLSHNQLTDDDYKLIGIYQRVISTLTFER